MSIAQKGTTTWLPRFLRRGENGGLNGTLPMDDRSIGRSLGGTPMPIEREVSPSLYDSAEMGAPLARIHPMACVDPKAILADDVEVGPFCVVGPHVRIGRGCRLMNNVTIIGHTTVGAHNVFFPNSVIGAQPQDKKFNGEVTRLEIGDNNHFRENVTIHLGTGKGGGLTRVGSNNLLMVNTHLGHDVVMGDNCIFANNVMLAGHVHIGSNVVLSGAVGIHHFVTVGDHVYAGGQTKISHDVPPFVKVDEENKIRGVNSVGLRRNGFSDVDVSAIEQAVWRLFLDRDREPVNTTLRKMRSGAAMPEIANNPQVNKVLEFLERRNLGRHGRYLESLRAG